MNPRAWATPLACGSLLLAGVTGLLLFFDIRLGLVKTAHEWSGLLLAGAAVLHIRLNWSALKAHLRGKTGRWIVALFALLTVLSLLPIRTKSRGGGERHAPGAQASQTP
ncbi:MAG: DUF4405 domain-containing protein [Elusimicrobia bacterium]|nr:DUF4405 domain-containing protein [Elusimicrobiota bacterium]